MTTASGAERPDGVIAILFDIDGTLITSGGASAVAWRRAFADLYGLSAAIGEFSHAGMTDPEVGRLTFTAVVGHDPTSTSRSAGTALTHRTAPS